jgi:hypothetical protein
MPLTISRILHAGYVFACDATQIAFDPIFENPFSRNCHAFPGVRFEQPQIRSLRFDAVFISHFHDDHCSLESLDLLDRATPIYLYCQFDELFAMIRELGFVDVRALSVDTPVQVGAITVTPRQALDAEVDSLFQLQADGLNILNVVDAWIDPDALEQLALFAPWDMVLWPFQTMRETDVLSPSRAQAAPAELPIEWIEQLQRLNPRYVVPSSCQFVQEPWSWYNHALFPVTYRQFAQEIGAALPGAQVIRLNPSVSVLLERSALREAPPLPWVSPVGEQDVDYEYDPTRGAPPTADIARHFPALSEQHTALVMAYCETGLAEKYRQMELPDDSYFEKPRVWQLSVVDHAGEVFAFRYRLQGDSLERLMAGDDAALGWTTEIPIAKLYAALELGESLTSMYMRINDTVFDELTEREIMWADVIDDPLIRCLFNDRFGAYQAAQLRRLQQRVAPG